METIVRDNRRWPMTQQLFCDWTSSSTCSVWLPLVNTMELGPGALLLDLKSNASSTLEQ